MDIEKTVIDPYYISGQEKLEFFALPCTGQAPYGFMIEGTSYDKEFLIAMTRSGAKQLALAILEKI